MAFTLTGLTSIISYFLGGAFGIGFMVKLYLMYEKEKVIIRLYTILLFLSITIGFILTGLAWLVLQLDYNRLLGILLIELGASTVGTSVIGGSLILGLLKNKLRTALIIIGASISALLCISFVLENAAYMIDDIIFTPMQLTFLSLDGAYIITTSFIIALSGYKMKNKRYSMLGGGMLMSTLALNIAVAVNDPVISTIFRSITMLGTILIYYSDKIKVKNAI